MKEESPEVGLTAQGRKGSEPAKLAPVSNKVIFLSILIDQKGQVPNSPIASYLPAFKPRGELPQVLGDAAATTHLEAG